MKYPINISEEYFTSEGCFILELVNHANHENTSIARARVPQGAKTRVHYLLHTKEYYHILQGSGLMYIQDKDPYEVNIGDTVFISENEHQSIENIGQEDLIFLCICHPRFKEENYVEIK
jgi:mannose-6-phosphate isomerase-like protein (cupin superfamily)